MTVLVVSDTHGRRDLIRRMLSHHPRYDAMLFLGDGSRDFDQNIMETGFVGVRGNCDWFLSDERFLSETTVNFDGVKIFMTHGHEYGVSFGMDKLIGRAAQLDADIAVFGHTHVPLEKYIPAGTQIGDAVTKKPMYLFNPGSLGAPRVGPRSFGIIEIRNGVPLMSFGKIR